MNEMTKVEKKVLEFITACLKDENGISEDANDMLLYIAGFSGAFSQQVFNLTAHTDGTDGRIYLKE